MVPTLQKLGIDELSVAERLELIGAIGTASWTLTRNHPHPNGISASWSSAGCREADPGGETPWEVVQARLETSDEFWRLIAERRRQATLSRAEFEQRIGRADGAE